MAWTKFTQTNQRFEDKITVTNTNSFGFSGKFYKDQGLNQYKYAIIYYDPERKAVGFSFNNTEEKYRFSIVTSKKSSGGQISARSFFRANNLDSSKYQGKYDWFVENHPEAGKLYVIILKEKEQMSQNISTPQETSPVPIVQPTQTDPISDNTQNIETYKTE